MLFIQSTRSPNNRLETHQQTIKTEKFAHEVSQGSTGPWTKSKAQVLRNNPEDGVDTKGNIDLRKKNKSNEDGRQEYIILPKTVLYRYSCVDILSPTKPQTNGSETRLCLETISQSPLRINNNTIRIAVNVIFSHYISITVS